ncbi:DUF5988 family protein [Streptomyces sp. NPDC091371]|uniref:DUF5988 family protein n=1 Tax=Streptomyces sp. NPDC091371 TaxID=3155303 RepID=UPI00344A96F9
MHTDPLDGTTIPALLVGGPRELPPVTRLRAGAVPEKVTVRHWGRHEHFLFTGRYTEVEGARAALFEWSYSTKIAE